MIDDEIACIPDCTPNMKDRSANEMDRNFADAIAVIAKLSLTEEEKAEAVRRLLKSQSAR